MKWIYKNDLNVLLVFLFTSIVFSSAICKDNHKLVSIDSLEENSLTRARINAGGGLRLRVKPNKKAKSLNIIPDGSLVEILETKKEEITLGSRKGHWTKIEWFDQAGWVFGAFLVPLRKGQNGTIVKNIAIDNDFTGDYISNKLQVKITDRLLYIKETNKKEVLAYCLLEKIKKVRTNKIVVFCNSNSLPENKELKLNFKASLTPELVILELKEEDKLKISASESLLDGTYKRD